MQTRTKIASLVAAITLVTGGLAIGAPTAGGSIYACLSPSAGTLTKVSTKAPKCPKGATLITWNQVGPTGRQGIQGLQGMQGPAGAPGATGQSGLNGLNGLTGPEGSQGVQGENGLQGAMGIKGDKGDPGRDGVSGTGLYAVSDGNLYPVYLHDKEAVVSIQGTWWQTISPLEYYSALDPTSWDLNATLGFTGSQWDPLPEAGDYLVFMNDNCSGAPMGWLSYLARYPENFYPDRVGITYLNGSAVTLFSKYYKATYLNLERSVIQSYKDNGETCQLGAPEDVVQSMFGPIRHKMYNLVEIEKPTIVFDAVLTTG